MTSVFMLLTLLQAPAAALENEYVRVTRDAVNCGEGGDGCGIGSWSCSIRLMWAAECADQRSGGAS